MSLTVYDQLNICIETCLIQNSLGLQTIDYVIGLPVTSLTIKFVSEDITNYNMTMNLNRLINDGKNT